MEETKSLIASDLDGVLVDFCGHFKEFAAENGYTVEGTGHYQYRVLDSNGNDINDNGHEINDLYSETYKQHEETPILPGAEEFVHRRVRPPNVRADREAFFDCHGKALHCCD